MKKFKYESQKDLYKYLKSNNDIFIENSSIAKDNKQLNKTDIYKVLSDFNKEGIVCKYKQGKYINKQALGEEFDNMSIFDKYKSLIRKLDKKYKSVIIYENPIHLAARKKLTQQTASMEFILMDVEHHDLEIADEVATYFSSLIGIKKNYIKIFRKRSIHDMREIITTLIDWNENPELNKIVDAINDGYRDLFHLYPKKDVHPKNSNILSHMLYGKIGRDEYHDLLKQGADKIYVEML